MIQIEDDNTDCIKGDKCYILFYFTATWCGPCQRIKPIIQEISKGVDDSKLKVYMVDIDTNPKLVEKYNIRSVPTLILLLEDTLVGTCCGTNNVKIMELFKIII